MSSHDPDERERRKLERDRAALLRAIAESSLPRISERILDALAEIPRERFVPPDAYALAYEDHPLPIGHAQTISQPHLVALMTQWVDPGANDVALEIGTGSGFQTALLARLVRHVYSVERIAALADSARARLAELGYRNVSIRTGDGWEGWPEHAPFDVIVVTAAALEVPPPLTEQLANGGRMILPVGSSTRGQELWLVEKDRMGQLHIRQLTPVAFVPFERGVVPSEGDDASDV